MKYAVLIPALLTLMFVGRMHAQSESSHSAAALELLEVMKTDSNLQQAVDVALTAQLKANPALTNYEDVMRAFLSKYMSWEYLKDDLVRLYAEEFTESELRTITAFYRTDVGKKAVEEIPALMRKGGELGQAAVRAHLDELSEAIKKKSGEMNAK